MWHKDLLGLGADDHPHYALLDGRPFGQTLVGGTGLGEWLILQSTTHPSRGYVKSADDLQLITGNVRGPNAALRVTLANASPHVTLSGLTRLTQEVAIGGIFPSANKLLNVQASPAPVTAYLRAIMGSPSASVPSGSPAGILRGLEFTVGPQGGGPDTTVSEVSAVYAYPITVFYTGTVSEMNGLKVPMFNLFGGSPSVTLAHGVNIGAIDRSQIVDAYGVLVRDITNNSGFRRLLELGPSTPYLRVVGGAAPPATFSNLYLNVGGALLQVRERTIGGFRCLTIN